MSTSNRAPSKSSRTRVRVPPPPCPYDVPFVPTPAPVIDRMMRLAQVTAADVVLDLGCGDGRMLVAAAQRGARGVGIDIDPSRVEAARTRATEAGFADRITIRRGNLFRASVRSSDVIVLFLLPHVLARLAERLQEARPGTRIISHAFPLPGWEAEQVVEVRRKQRFQRKLYLYRCE